jgi:predicted HD phosphohydrolase
VLEVFARRAYDPTVIRAGERVPLIDLEKARTRTGASA